MASNRSKPHTVPRSINVQKFAESRGPELEALQSIVASRLNDDFRSQRNSRRRTTGHDDRLAKKNGKKRKRRGVGNRGAMGQPEEEKRVSRRVRRKMELKDNPVDGFSTSGDGTKRLRTHVWHAKRFTMTKLWGFHLPLGLQGRGRGSRALLKWYKHGALVHDASYCTCIELEGLENSLLSVLKSVLIPPLETKLEDDCPILSGLICGNAMLHHVRSSSQEITPVTYMWRPVQLQKIFPDVQCDNKEFGDSNRLRHNSCHRQLWMWLHGAAFDEGLEALKVACSKLMNETGQAITLSSLDGKVTKFEVMGSKAWPVLQKVLKCVRSDNELQLKACSTLKPHSDPQQVKSLKPENEDTSVSHSILSLTVIDPRDLAIGTSVVVSDDDSPLPSFRMSSNVEEEGSDTIGQWDDVKISSSSKLTSGNATNGSLWHARNGVLPPVNEHSLSVEKHNLRLSSYSIADPSSKTSVDVAKSKFSGTCPIMLVKDGNNMGSHIRWTLIIPVSWARTFWTRLILNGAHAIGLREKHWVASDVGLPFFPSDFPDCNAYVSFKASEATKFNPEAEWCPLARAVPVPPPWNCVRLSLDADFYNSTASNTNQSSNGEVAVHVGLSGRPDNIPSHNVGQNLDATQFSGTVARTSSELDRFLDQNIGHHFPLFSFSTDKERISEWVLSENIDQAQIRQQKRNPNLLFVRVFLHSYKEGFFEEGAVVCAPFLADIQSWISSLDGDEERLHIPQSSASSYFIEKSPGHWTLQIPEDHASLKNHRWPIGFVTSGFVRGSKKASACAFCDASLLGRVRQEQWKNLPAIKRKKDIYVLVRNLRSNTYRLAIANIVLEHQEVDTEFM